LLGKVISSIKGGVLTAAMITETEAYPSWDAGSHLFGRENPTPRTAIQLEQGGLLYMYFDYGIICNTSVVTGEHGNADVVIYLERFSHYLA